MRERERGTEKASGGGNERAESLGKWWYGDLAGEGVTHCLSVTARPVSSIEQPYFFIVDILRKAFLLTLLSFVCVTNYVFTQ